MPQGKNMKIDKIKETCLSILRDLNQTQVSKKHGISRSSVQRFQNALKVAQITSIEKLTSISDENLIKVIYGENAKIENYGSVKASIEIKRGSKINQDYYEPDWQKYASEFISDKRCKKSDIFVDYQKEASEKNLLSYKYTAFSSRLNAAIKQIKGPNVYMHKSYTYGEELQLDWAGDTFKIIDSDKNIRDFYVMVLAWPRVNSILCKL